jgi:hypothetical protein
MAATQSRSFFVTLFGLVGTLWFALHAVEYVFARYARLDAIITLPAPLGLGGFFAELPIWASVALTATIWLGLLGAFLLLLGDRASVFVLSLCVIAALVTLAWGILAFAQGAGPMGGVDPLFLAAGQAAVAVGLWLYARTAKRYGTL